MPNPQAEEKPRQDNPGQQLHQASGSRRRVMLAFVKPRSKEQFLALFWVFLGLIILVGFPLLLTIGKPPSVGKSVGSDAFTSPITIGFIIVLLLLFALIGYQAAGLIRRYRNSPRSNPNFRTTYRPSLLLRSTTDSPTFHIRIREEPLTAQNFSLLISALTELHTKCWLIAKGRFADLIEYSQTRNARFPQEAYLIISKITQNSPVDVKFTVNADASAQGIVEALKLGIDAVSQAPLRHKEQQLANQAKELEMKLQELQTQSELDDKRQSREINAQRAALELERQRLEIDRQQVALQKERLEYQIAARDFAFETATMMIEKLYPEVDKSSKAMLIRTLIPELLQLGNGKGLELALPAPQINEENSEDK